MRKVFLKLDGIKGEALCARHIGEIEVASFYWGSKQPLSSAGGERTGMIDLTIVKQVDGISPELSTASKTGRCFEGQLTLEDFSASGGLVRSIVFELRSVFVNSATRIGAAEVVRLSCRSIKLAGTDKINARNARKGERKIEPEKEVTVKKRNLLIISILIIALALGFTSASAQFAVGLPDAGSGKPEKVRTETGDSGSAGRCRDSEIVRAGARTSPAALGPSDFAGQNCRRGG